MSKKNAGAGPPKPGQVLDEALIRAWRTGDAQARDRLWELLFARVYTVAVRYCLGLGLAAAAAEEAAAEGFLRAMSELDPSKKAITIKWYGERQFVAFVLTRVRQRCHDAARIEWREINHVADAQGREDETEGDFLESLGCTPARQEELVRGELLRRVVRLLGAWREICRDRKALADLVASIQECVRQGLLDAFREQPEWGQGGGRVSLSLDELVDVVDPERLVLTKPTMYACVGARLGLDRNVLYLRMRELRKLLTA